MRVIDLVRGVAAGYALRALRLIANVIVVPFLLVSSLKRRDSVELLVPHVAEAECDVLRAQRETVPFRPNEF